MTDGWEDFPLEMRDGDMEAALNHPRLFEYITNVEIPKQIVGELDTIHTIFLCSCGMLVGNAKKTSYNLIVNDETGTGKDWVTEKTLEIWKEKKFDYLIVRENKEGEDIERKSEGIVIKRTRISEKVFTYWHNPKFEPDFTWDGKIFYNEDISEHVLNSDVFKVMASSGSQATILVNQMPIDIEIKGKPVMIVTTAAATPNPEDLRRFTLINLDGTTDQTSAILKRQAEAAGLGTSLEYNGSLCKALAELERVKVKIPFAEKLLDFFPKEKVIMRTVFERFLDYIKASAAIHQRQRQTDLDGFIIAEEQDYLIARVALMKTVSNQYMVPITKDQKRLYLILRDMGNGYWSVAEIEGKVAFMSDKWLRVNLDKLTDIGLLSKSSEERAESTKRVMVYKPVPLIMVDLPTIVEQLYCTNGTTCTPLEDNIFPTTATTPSSATDTINHTPNTIATTTSNNNKEEKKSDKKEGTLKDFAYSKA